MILFLLGCILDIFVGMAIDESFGTAAAFVSTAERVRRSSVDFYSIAMVGVGLQLLIIMFGAREYERKGVMDAGVISALIFLCLPVFYFLVFVFASVLMGPTAIVRASMDLAFMIVSLIAFVLRSMSEWDAKKSEI
ncbi:MAG TPA: hypothetical protein VN420_00375 [Candidatus Fimivivens sp.]|nr:hypothetical protein [Candidatus Fimivivens sp.]